VAGLVFAWLLAGQAPASTAGLFATFGAVLATDLLSAVLVTAAISLNEGALTVERLGRRWPRGPLRR
jgi:hypothetical protein